MFSGEYGLTVDVKGRIAVPAKFRAQLDAGAVVSRWMESCLAVHTPEGWARISAKVEALPLTDATGRMFSRFLYGGASEVELDRQGRILVPAFLREGIGLTVEAAVIGLRDHIEIWAPSTWDGYRRALDDPDELTRAFSGLGI
ncbi:MAG: division/cell wall cluster transcriptional repressor MraZ [Candidatus Limnocylindrales bacterium]